MSEQPSDRRRRRPSPPAPVGAALAVLAAGLLAALAGCSGSTQGNTSGVAGNGSSFVPGQGVRTMLPVSARREPVQLSGKTLAGDRLDLATLRGKPVVVNVWGSWCPPCRKEAPQLQAAAAELAGKASFVGIDTRDDGGLAQAFERKFQISYPSLVDTGTLLLAFNGAVPPQSIPTTLVLDPQGRIAARFTGPVTKLTVIGMVQDVATSAGAGS